MNKLWLLSFIPVTMVIYLLKPNFHSSSPADQVVASPSQNPVATAKPQVAAWIAWWDQDKTAEYFSKTNGQVSSVSPLLYKLNTNGQIRQIPGLAKPEQISSLSATLNTQILPTIINDFDSKRVTRFLKSPPLQKSAIDFLVKTAIANNFQGWDLDWEQINKADRERFSAFVHQLAIKLHQENLLLSIAVHARTGSANDWEGAKGQDYASLGKSADFIRLMAYDYHYESSAPGPVTPLNDLEKTLKYAKSTIPESKIVVGLPTYGYDWVGSKGEGLQYNQIIDRLSKLNVQSYRDSTSSALRADYTAAGKDHHVWYEDATSILRKINLAQGMGLNQFILWRLGGEDPNLWSPTP